MLNFQRFSWKLMAHRGLLLGLVPALLADPLCALSPLSDPCSPVSALSSPLSAFRSHALIPVLLLSPRLPKGADIIQLKSTLSRFLNRKPADLGISNRHNGGRTRRDHLVYHKQIEAAATIEKFVSTLQSLGVEISRPNPKAPFDFRAMMNSDANAGFIEGQSGHNGHGNLHFQKKFIEGLKALDPRFVDFRIEWDGVVLLIHEGFKGGHAGRSGMVMAPSEEVAFHESRELRELALWAYKEGVASVSRIQRGELGLALREWLNVGGLLGIRRRIQYFGVHLGPWTLRLGAADLHHLEGLKAEAAAKDFIKTGRKVDAVALELSDEKADRYHRLKLNFREGSNPSHLPDSPDELHRYDSTIARWDSSGPSRSDGRRKGLPGEIANPKGLTWHDQLMHAIHVAQAVPEQLQMPGTKGNILSFMRENPTATRSEVAKALKLDPTALSSHQSRIIMDLKLRSGQTLDAPLQRQSAGSSGPQVLGGTRISPDLVRMLKSYAFGIHYVHEIIDKATLLQISMDASDRWKLQKELAREGVAAQLISNEERVILESRPEARPDRKATDHEELELLIANNLFPNDIPLTREEIEHVDLLKLGPRSLGGVKNKLNQATARIERREARLLALARHALKIPEEEPIRHYIHGTGGQTEFPAWMLLPYLNQASFFPDFTPVTFIVGLLAGIAVILYDILDVRFPALPSHLFTADETLPDISSPQPVEDIPAVRVARELPLFNAGGQNKSLDELREDYIQALYPKDPPLPYASQLRDGLFSYLNGLVAIPLLFLFTQPVIADKPTLFTYLQQPRTLAEIAHQYNPGREQENMGAKYGALRTLMLQGWVEMAGKDENTTFVLTPEGRIIHRRATAPEQAAVLQRAALLFDDSHQFHDRTKIFPDQPDFLLRVDDVLHDSEVRWFSDPQDADNQTIEIDRRLRDLLDGAMVSAAMVALNKPTFDDNGHVTVPAVMDLLVRENGVLQLDLDDLPNDFNPVPIQRMMQAIITAKPFGKPLARWADPERQTQFQLTPEGEAFFDKKGSFGVPVSYVRPYQYQNLKDMIFNPDRPDPLDLPGHKHVDQLTNSWGAHLQHVNYYPDLLRIILPLVEEGLPGLMESTAGNGSIVAHVSAASIGWKQVLARYSGQAIPLHTSWVAIASDYSLDLKGRIEETFRKVLPWRLGATTAIITGPKEADISQPRRLRAAADAALARLGSTFRVKDLLNLVMFGIEERDFHIKTEKQAIRVFTRQVTRLLGNAEGRAALLDMLIEMEALPKGTLQLPRTEDLIRLVKEQFTISHNEGGRLVPAEVSAADLIDFVRRLAAITPQGLLTFDVLTPGNAAPHLAAPAYWGSHWLREKIYTEKQRRLAYVLAGMKIEKAISKGTPATVGLIWMRPFNSSKPVSLRAAPNPKRAFQSAA